MTVHYPVIVIQEKRRFWAYVPDLPGVYGIGGTKAQAKRDLIDALKLYVEDCKADGDPIPCSAAKIVQVAEVAISA